MRKVLGNRIILAVSFLIAMSIWLAVLSFRITNSYCANTPQCNDKKMELIKDGEMFWETLSHHYIKAAGY